MRKLNTETDYRKIPREHLNPRIPKGRGMVKWQAFATIPEQYERIQQHIKNQNKVDKPILSDDQLNELNNTLIEKLYLNPSCEIKYYSNGYIKEIKGDLQKLDSLENKLYINVEHTLIKIDLLNIVGIN